MWYIKETKFLDEYFELLKIDYSDFFGNKESHHIHPVALGGKENGIKEVPTRVHIKLHYLLFEHFSEIGNIEGIKKSEKAFMLMASTRKLEDIEDIEDIFENYGVVRDSFIENMKGSGNPMHGKLRPIHSSNMSGNGNPMYGVTHSKEKWESISKNMKGKCSGAKNQGAKKWILISPEGELIKIHGELKKVTKELGLSENSLYKNLGKVVEYNRFGRGNSYKRTIGWKLERGINEE